MKNLNPSQIKIMSALSDGSCQSGNALAADLGVSRTAIWKQIKQLVALQAPIRCLHQGYQLHQPLILLNTERIEHTLNHFKWSKSFKVHTITQLDSTNYFLKNLPRSTFVDVCCAETQTEGRGRFSRSWHSPFGENIYCSSRWHFDCDLSLLSGLSLVVSLATIKTLQDFEIDQLKIKWPNDILWQHKKLSGSLIEVSAESNGSVEVIIGIGINVNMKSILPLEMDKPWCSLVQITQQFWDRNDIICALLKNLAETLDEFISHGFAVFIERWEKVDYLQGHSITVSNHQGAITGLAQSVNESGQLLLKQGNQLHSLSAGDTTLAT